MASSALRNSQQIKQPPFPRTADGTGSGKVLNSALGTGKGNVVNGLPGVSKAAKGKG